LGYRLCTPKYFDFSFSFTKTTCRLVLQPASVDNIVENVKVLSFLDL
jgi:hypothetical protein